MRSRFTRAGRTGLALIGAALAVACTEPGSAGPDTTAVAAPPASSAPPSTDAPPSTGGSAPTSAPAPSAGGPATSAAAPATTTLPPRPADLTGLFDSRAVHEVSVEVERDAYSYMLRVYERSEDKVWIPAKITIDGVTYDRVGMRLKGNTSLARLVEEAGTTEGGTDPDVTGAYAPWLVQLDRFKRGQNHEGYTQFAIRSNASPTALNEAVALDLLGQTGLAGQLATPVRFTVNGGPTVLRLLIENPNPTWDARYFTEPGILYKAKSGGDYRYRGRAVAAYDEIFEQESGEALDFRPLIRFLQFVSEASDEEFVAELGDWLDLAAFARYLAFEELVANYDDIDGPGNNSFLRWGLDAERFTVVAWDHNLAFRGPNGLDPVPDPVGEGPAANPLVQRFTAHPPFAAMVDQQRQELRALLFDSGLAGEVLVRWTHVLARDATDLVTGDELARDVAEIEGYLAAG